MKCKNCHKEIRLFHCAVDADPEGEKSRGLITVEVLCTDCAPNERLNAIVREGGDAVRTHILTQREWDLLEEARKGMK